MFAKEKIMVDLNELQKRIYDNKIKKGFNTTIKISRKKN